MASKIRVLAKLLAVATVWYFLAAPFEGSGSFTQVGPFASQDACESYRSQVSQETLTIPCWSSGKK